MNDLINITNILVFLALSVIIYTVFRMIYMNETTLIEGLTNNKSTKDTLQDIEKKITSMNNSLTEMLNLDKNKSEYENVIIAVDDLMDKMILSSLVTELDKHEGNPSESLKEPFMNKINNMVEFKKNLNNVMDSLDKASSSS